MLDQKTIKIAINALLILKEAQIFNGLTQSHTPETIEIGQGLPLFKKDISGPEAAILMITKFSPNDINSEIQHTFENMGFDSKKQYSDEELNTFVSEATNNIINKYKNLLSSFNPQLTKGVNL